MKDIIKSQDIADNMLENSNTSSVNYSSHLADAGADYQEIEISPADFVIFPKGLTCYWKVLKPIKKHYIFS